MNLEQMQSKRQDMLNRFQMMLDQAEELSRQHTQAIANANAVKGAVQILEQLIDEEKAELKNADDAKAEAKKPGTVVDFPTPSDAPPVDDAAVDGQNNPKVS